MKHVALVIPTLDRLGGAERQVMVLARGLLKRGWWVSVIALSGTGGTAVSELLAAGAGFLSLHMRKGLADPRGWVRLHHWLRSEAPDVVHAHLPHAAWMSRWSRLFAPTRVLIDTIHTSATGTRGRRLGYRWSDWLSDRVTAVSQDAAEAYRAANMVLSRHLSVLPNGVDVEQFRPDPQIRATMRQELGLTSEFLWLAAGRLDPVKNFPALLRAFAALPEPARLAIAGDGPLMRELNRLCNQLHLQSRVRFVGFQPDVRNWMQAADAFVLSSLWEGLPMSLLEAGACALPAVASDVPGTAEVLVDGLTGLLTLTGGTEGLQDAMERLMCLPAVAREEMGRRARRHVVKNFSLESVLDRWETLYLKLLERHPIPARWSDRRTQF